VPEARYEGRAYTLDEGGFLDPPEQWDEAYARGTAAEMGIRSLGERHWRILRYLRRQLVDQHRVPYFVIACMENGLRIAEFRTLFPDGYHRGACRIAGISLAAMVASDVAHTYEVVPPPAARHPIGPLGFLARFEAWDEDFAARVAGELGVELTERHRQVLAFLREAYAARGACPAVRETCRAVGLSRGELEALFPGGYRRGACRMAGLPLVP
jgi:tRNA 2-thiouridine synthesizing protein E